MAGAYLKEAIDKELTPEEILYCTPINSTKKPGKKARHNHKTMMLTNLSGIIEKGKLVIPHDESDRLKPLKSELKYYKLKDKGIPNDCVMSLALAAYAFKRRKDTEQYTDILERHTSGGYFDQADDFRMGWAA